MRIPSNSRIYKSFAKVNLWLKLGAVREDGYHALSSLFQTVGLYDLLYIAGAQHDSLEVTGPFPVTSGSENLVLKALDLLRKHCRTDRRFALKLVKNIPAQAGLGGGSSNAMTLLAAVDSLCGLGLSARDFLELAAELGSDVPFFYYGGAVLVEGRGEILRPCAVEDRFGVILVRPDFSVSTPDAYALWDRCAGAENPRGGPVLFENDFERVIGPLYPVVGEIGKLLKEAGALGACLTGSGSTVAGFFESGLAAAGAFSLYDFSRFGWAFLTETTERAAYRSELFPGRPEETF